MRDYSIFDSYLNQLTADVYAQPPDAGHTAWALHAIATLCAIPQGLTNVLDVGCGQGFLQPVFKGRGLDWTGVCLGEDYQIAKERGLKVHEADMTFLPFQDGTFDLVFARHVLEHSPFPVITLMEWKRVVRAGGFLIVIAPAPAYWQVRGRNHYSVLSQKQLAWLMIRAGWNPIHDHAMTTRSEIFIRHTPASPAWQDQDEMDVEYRFLCEQRPPVLE